LSIKRFNLLVYIKVCKNRRIWLKTLPHAPFLMSVYKMLRLQAISNKP
jgi:hypothetical protein